MAYDYRKLDNYWIQQSIKREEKPRHELIQESWKTCQDYVANFENDQENFDFEFFRELMKDYVKTVLPDVTESRCNDLVEMCLKLANKNLEYNI